MTPPARYFEPDEIACRCGCGFDGADPDFLELLDRLREAVGEPLQVSSFCRCPNHNQAIGGIPQSPHTKGLAVDLMCLDDRLRQGLVNNWSRLLDATNQERAGAGLELFPFRLELGYDYLHLDVDRSRPPRVWFNEVNFRYALG